MFCIMIIYLIYEIIICDMNIYVDIDDTICFYNHKEGLNYSNAIPYNKRIMHINYLYDQGNYIVYWTARGSVTGIDWREITEGQLNKWGCKYHKLMLKKPAYDLFIDDKNINCHEYFKNTINKSIEITKKNTNDLKILCIIPARSGSKGVIDKNIKLFNGKPLLSWSIIQMMKSKYYKNTRIFVSTDSNNYKDIALEYGAEVPVLRPKSISEDNSTDFECIKHAYN